MSKLKKCKACDAEISKSAKKCPQCGHRNKGLFGKIVLWSFLGLVGLTVLGAIVGGSENTATVGSSSQMPATEIYAIGDTVSGGDFAVSIQDIETRRSVGDQYFEKKPATGAIYVIVDFSYLNQSDKPKSSFSAPSIKLRDSNGTSYSQDTGATTYYATERELNAKGMSDINPGIQIDDASVFEISESLFDKGGWTIFVNNGRHDFQVGID